MPSNGEARTDNNDKRAGSQTEVGALATDVAAKSEWWKTLMKQAIDEITPADLQELAQDKPENFRAKRYSQKSFMSTSNR